MKHIFLPIFLLLVFSACAQQPEGRDILDASRLKFLTSKAEGSQVEVTKENETNVVRFITETQPKFIYNYATSLPLQKEKLNEGDVVLLSFEAITEKSSEETGEAKLLIQLKQSGSFKQNLDRTLNIGSVWKRYFIPFQTTQSISPKNLGVMLQYGFEPQTIALKNISFQVYPRGTLLQDLPKTEVTYQGMEPDAQWRKDALARIEQIRKGDFQIEVTQDGKPVPNAQIEVELKRHYFPFGVAMDAEEILNNKDKYNRFKEAFGLTVLANDLKIKRWSRKENRATTLKALDKLKADGISVKGHVLIWPGFQYNPASIKKLKNDPVKLEKAIKSHVYNILDATEGKVTHWDVANETYTNKDFQNILGSEELLYDGFRILRNRQPNVSRFTNEYGIISKGGIDTQKQQWYYDYIKRVDTNTNGAVQGIGIQSHMGTDLTPPEKVLSLLSYYASLGKRISISEFTMDETDPKIREQYTRDFMIATFSHPNVSEFLFWGFQDDDGRGKVDIYEADESIGEMGKAYFSLVNGDWKTTLSRKLNEQGAISDRGFYGLYTYKVLVDGVEKTGSFEVVPNASNQIQIQL
ncbi:hypothetical protein EAX61_01905 [Dokdonia sinensis]|uniref:GH10 domain-containing protein n=1 Tax=Dokdonia sinensis TaxID=2479847 RepID=A0A3M0H390_9FLAO|nr:endo-1,4-beta-xylanase [Dokdonia sinensis]RMB64156.1 hypothetical protein EAX61_01905 [Dokdonia sinensis]